MTAATGDALSAAMAAGIKQEVDRIIQEEAIEAGKRVEKRVRDASAQIAANVCEQIDFMRMTDRLIITLKISKENAS